MAVIIQKAFKHTLLSHQPKISGKTYEILNTFTQNKPNFQNAQMNVSIYLQMTYENKYNWTLGENKPNQTQSKPVLSAVEWANLEKTAFSSSLRRGGVLEGFRCEKVLDKTRFEVLFS